ncbi:MAG TPA: hypothetical protein VGP64_00415 [Polyangia bacterium]|jgi:hypothetical protein
MSDRQLLEGGSARTTPGGDALAEAESNVERARERVESSLMALREEVARQTDWRRWVRRRPATFLGGALALGFLLGYRR